MLFLPDQLYDDHYDRHGQIPICYKVIYAVTLCMLRFDLIYYKYVRRSLNFLLQHASKGWPGFALCWVNLDSFTLGHGCLSLFSGVKNAWLSSSVSGALCTCGVMSLGYISKSGISGSQDMNIFRLVKQVPKWRSQKGHTGFHCHQQRLGMPSTAPREYVLCCAVLCLVIQSFLTLFYPMDCSLPGSSVHGDSPGKNTGVGCYVLLQGICPTKGSNPGLLHCRPILYHLSH